MRRNRRWRTWTVVATAMLLGLVREAAAHPTRESLVEDYQTVQRALVAAAVDVYGAQRAAATATLDQALAALEAAHEPVDARLARSIGVKFGALRGGLQKSRSAIGRVRRAIDKGTKFAIQLRKLSIASRVVRAAAGRIGAPVIAELDPRSAGFHDPGEQVALQIYAVDGTPCVEPAEVVVENGSLAQAIDAGSLAVDRSSGVVTLVMGADQGSGSVGVTACGRSSSVLLYNYGPPPPPGLPKGFPTNLPDGLYQLTFSARGTGVSIPTTIVGTLQMDDLETFATSINDAFQQLSISIVVPGCSERVRYTAYDGEGFSISVKMACSLPGVSVNVSVSIRVERVG